MQILMIEGEPEPTDGVSYVDRPNPLRMFTITYKTEDSEENQTMVVFATEEVLAISKALQAYETNQGVRALQTILGESK